MTYNETGNPSDIIVDDHDSGVSYHFWTNGTAVGYEIHFPDNRIEFIYLNPSDGGDDGVPTVFAYQGPDADPAADSSLCYFDVRPDKGGWRPFNDPDTPADNPDSVKLVQLRFEATNLDDGDSFLHWLACNGVISLTDYRANKWYPKNDMIHVPTSRVAEVKDLPDNIGVEVEVWDDEPAADSVEPMGLEERLAAVRARARYMGVNTIDLTDLFTVEIGGQEEDVVITMETAEHLYRQLEFLLGHDENDGDLSDEDIIVLLSEHHRISYATPPEHRSTGAQEAAEEMIGTLVRAGYEDGDFPWLQPEWTPPTPKAKYFTSPGDRVVPATAWYYSRGDMWVAVDVERYPEAEWFEDDQNDRSEWPAVRVRPIADVPTSGMLCYRLVDGTDVTEPVRAMDRALVSRAEPWPKRNDPMVRYPLTATCEVCGESLQFDIDPGGTPGQNGDWGANGDYGCITGDDEGSDGHTPVGIRWEPKED